MHPTSNRVARAGILLALVLPATSMSTPANALPVTAAPVARAWAQESSEAEFSRPRTTLVHLSNGSILRTLARSSEGRWQVRRGAEWIQLPMDLVTRAVSEADALHDARRLGREVKRGGNDPVRRVAFVDWLLSEGLQIEALEELDRILRENPDQADARDLIARARLPVALPTLPRGDSSARGSSDELEPFLVAASRGGPAVAEIALQRLEEAGEVPGLVQRLPMELQHRRPERRGFAAHAMRRLMPGRHLEPLLTRAVLDTKEDVRRAAALALGSAEDAGVIVPLVRAFASQRGELRLHAVEALGEMPYRAAVAPLYAHLLNLQSGRSSSNVPRSHIYVGTQTAIVQDYDVEVASGSAIADPVINIVTEGSVLDAALVGVHEYSVQVERAAVRRSLTRLTGATPGNTTSAWRRWWDEHGDEWTVVPEPPATSTTSSRRDR